MTKRPLPCPTLLRQLLDYDPDTGVLTWKRRPVEMFPSARIAKAWNTRNAGKITFIQWHQGGYLVGSVLGHRHLAHRVAYAIQHGAWPLDEVDHINGNRKDNRAENLRDVGRVTNSRNCSRSKLNTSGVTGVHWDNARGKWAARIKEDYKVIHLGRFDDFADAVATRKAAEIKHGFHKGHGKEAV